MYLGFDIKYRSSKIHVFLLFIKPDFPMFVKSQDCSSKCGCILKAVRGTWNFVWQQATLVQGCTSEAQLNMDVNLCRLPDESIIMPKFPVPLAGVMRHLFSTDSAAIQSKQPEKQFISMKNMHSKNCWHFISDKDNPL